MITVTTITIHGKHCATVCANLFDAIEFVRGLEELGGFVSIRIEDDEMKEAA